MLRFRVRTHLFSPAASLKEVSGLIKQNDLSENCLIGNVVMTGGVVLCILSLYLFRDYASYFVMGYYIWSHGCFFCKFAL